MIDFYNLETLTVFFGFGTQQFRIDIRREISDETVISSLQKILRNTLSNATRAASDYRSFQLISPLPEGST
jgi:hypothetical protein